MYPVMKKILSTSKNKLIGRKLLVNHFNKRLLQGKGSYGSSQPFELSYVSKGFSGLKKFQTLHGHVSV